MIAPDHLQLPEECTRIIVLDSLHRLGAVCASSLALSPLVRSAQEVVWGDTVAQAHTQASQPQQHSDARNYHVAEARNSLLRLQEGIERTISGGPEQPVSPLGDSTITRDNLPTLFGRIHLQGDEEQPSMMGRQASRTLLVPDTLRDLFVYVVNSDTTSIEQILLHIRPLLFTYGGEPLRLIIIGDDRSRQHMSSVVSLLEERTSWRVLFAWVREFGPPALHLGTTVASVVEPGGLLSMLPSICAGVALGVLRHFPAPRSEPLSVVPVDLAINAALMTMMLFLRGSYPFTFSSAAHITAISIGLTQTDTPLWGVVGDYLTNYYTRYAAQIRSAFPVNGLLSTSPSLHFPLPGAVICGVDASEPLKFLDHRGDKRQRQRLLTVFPNSTTTRHLKDILRFLDSALERVRPQLANSHTASTAWPKGVIQTIIEARNRTVSGKHPNKLSPLDFNASTYRFLLMRLSSDYRTTPLLPYVSIQDLDVEMYVYTIAKAVLEHLACNLLRHDSRALRLPMPTRIFHNDLVFHGCGQAPRAPTLFRHLLPGADWFLRAGVGPGGNPTQFSPGMTPQRLVSILAQPDVQRIISCVAADEGVSKEEVAARAQRVLLRIGDHLSSIECRGMGIAVYSAFKKMFEQVNVNRGAYEKLFRLQNMPRVQVVLIPLHRSYIDFLALTYMLGSMRLHVPHIVTGEDFLQMGKVSEMMRRSGAFFMRRSFRGDALYSTLFREYVRQLVRHRQPLEFFMEGARSRTGKTMAPKLGILKFITDAYFEEQNELDDVLLVPISLSYDELLEAGLYADEMLGIPKPKESVHNLLMATKAVLSHRHGSINIHVGDALSLRSFREDATQCPAPFLPKVKPMTGRPHGPPAVPSREQNPSPAVVPTQSTFRHKTYTPAPFLSALGWRITYELQRNVVITPPALLAAAVECLSTLFRLPHDGRGMPLSRMASCIEWLRASIAKRHGNLSSELASYDAARLVQQALQHLSRFIRVDEYSNVVVYPATVSSHIGLNISTNQLIHVFIDEAVVAIIAHAHGTPITFSTKGRCTSDCDAMEPLTQETAAATTIRLLSMDTVTKAAQLLQPLLAREFPNFLQTSPCSFSSWIQFAVSRLHTGNEEREVVEASQREPAVMTERIPVIVPSTQLYYFLTQLLFPHIDAIFLVSFCALTLFQAFPGRLLPVRTMLQATQKAAVQLHAGGYLDYATTCAKDLLQHYYESLVDVAVLELRHAGSAGSSYECSDKTGGSLRKIIEQVNKLRWHPSPALDADGKAMEKAILEQYSKYSQRAKM